MKKCLLAGVVIGVVTVAMIGSVVAADMPVPGASTVIPVPVYTWTGFYVGLHGGWGFGNAHLSNNTDIVLDDHATNGGLVGGHIGYNWQMGYSWLIGLEASGTWSDVKKTVTDPLDAFPNDRWTTEVKWLATVTPRIGATISNWMWYLKGGVAFAGIDHSFTSPVGPQSFDISSTTVGWTAGLGGELLLGNWILGVEGNVYGFGSFNVNSGIANFPNHDVEVTMWSILARVSYKFGGPSGPGPVVARY